MDSVEQYRELIERLLLESAAIPYYTPEIWIEPVFDRERDRYLLMIMGRQNGRRVHGCLVHIDIIDGKIWVQRDGTEYGMAAELADAGVPKSRIVLGFRSPQVRLMGEFAAA